MMIQLHILLIVCLVATTSCIYTSPPEISRLARVVKVAPELLKLHEDYMAHIAFGKPEPFRPSNPLLIIVEDRVLIDAVASGPVEPLKSDLISLGMQEAVAFGRIVSGQLPISLIPQVAKLQGLKFVRPATPIIQHGPVSPIG